MSVYIVPMGKKKIWFSLRSTAAALRFFDQRDHPTKECIISLELTIIYYNFFGKVKKTNKEWICPSQKIKKKSKVLQKTFKQANLPNTCF